MDEAEAWVMQPTYDKEEDRITLHMYPLVLCKDCRKNLICELTVGKPKEWFCADGRSKDNA